MVLKLALAGVLALVSASGILLGLRQKELIAITPVYFLIVSIALISAAFILSSCEKS